MLRSWSASVFILIAACVPLQAQSAATLRAKFGQAHIQRFRIDENVRLTIEYDASGAVSAARIAPPGYTEEAANMPGKLMDSQVVDAALEAIAPGLLAQKNAPTLVQQMSRNSLVTTNYDGCRLSRQFLWSAGKNETVILTLVGSPRCSSGNRAASLETRYGLPESEQFLLSGNIDLIATYASTGSLTQIDLVPKEHLLFDRPREVPMMNSSIVEQVMNYFAPPEAMLHPTHRVLRNRGAYDDIVSDDKLSTIRTFENGILASASIRWAQP